MCVRMRGKNIGRGTGTCAHRCPPLPADGHLYEVADHRGGTAKDTVNKLFVSFCPQKPTNK